MGVDELRQSLRIGLVAVVGENGILDEIGDVRAMAEGFRDSGARRLSRSAKHRAAKLHAKFVGKLAPRAEQLPRDGMNFTALLFDEHPHMFVAAKMFRQLFLGGGAARGLGCWSFGHLALLV